MLPGQLSLQLHVLQCRLASHHLVLQTVPTSASASAGALLMPSRPARERLCSCLPSVQDWEPLRVALGAALGVALGAALGAALAALSPGFDWVAKITEGLSQDLGAHTVRDDMPDINIGCG
jgi:hypothetical protein